MTENESSSMIDMDSKFWRTTLLIIAVLLIFAGPTYVPFVLERNTKRELHCINSGGGRASHNGFATVVVPYPQEDYRVERLPQIPQGASSEFSSLDSSSAFNRCFMYSIKRHSQAQEKAYYDIHSDIPSMQENKNKRLRNLCLEISLQSELP